MSLHILCCVCGKEIAKGDMCETCREKEMNVKFKTFKSLIDSGALVIPKHAMDLVKPLYASTFVPLGLCANVKINIEVFDRATGDGWKLNLFTAKYYKGLIG